MLRCRPAQREGSDAAVLLERGGRRTAPALRDSLAETYAGCDVELQMGGQPLYYYLIAVE